MFIRHSDNTIILLTIYLDYIEILISYLGGCSMLDMKCSIFPTSLLWLLCCPRYPLSYLLYPRLYDSLMDTILLTIKILLTVFNFTYRTMKQPASMMCSV